MALETTDLGPMELLAPDEPPHALRGTHGRMWQWIGDGSELFTLAVAVRETRLGNAHGTRDHLAWELRQLQPQGPDGADAPEVRDVAVLVPGATAAAAADVSGEVRGHAVRHRVVVSTDGEVMHVVRVVVPDNPVGGELADRVSSSLKVRAAQEPA
ncbi:hypothetical protein [Nocardioides aequoreus]|uniref:hypothetical protein n=1 Tax=Nocardioides aequoreus TaxID=397278 RepID=UPI0004C40711|nr:hypothetical protein [Nocardioides aequoreus]